MTFAFLALGLAACSSLSAPSLWQPEPIRTLTLYPVYASDDPLPPEQVLKALHNAEGELEALLPVEIRIVDEPEAGACPIWFATFTEFASFSLAGYGSIAVARTTPSDCQIVFRGSDLFADPHYYSTVLRHEIGHLLGMDHNTQDRDSVMGTGRSRDGRYRFTERDLRAVAD